MAIKKQLGIYFGAQTLSVVETNNQVPEKFVTASHGMFNKPEGMPAQPLPDDITLTAIIQKTLREQKITTTEVNLALPTKDVLFRSFVIPWMQPSEVKGVVEFEARKYIPFKLDELVYTYHAHTFTEDKTKKIRILFTATKKDIFDRYVGVLEQSGLTAAFIEPAAMSLVRALTLRNQIPSNQNIAIVQATEKEGRIIIVSDGIPQFIREFQLLPSGTQIAQVDPEVLDIRFFNEIRNSLSYYFRQHERQKIDGIIALTVDESSRAMGNLGKELGIATVSLNANSVLGTSSVVDIDILYAFGTGLKGTVPLPATFDLLPRTSSPFQFSRENIDTRALSKIAAGCLIFLVLAFVFSTRITAQYAQKIKTLEGQQGPHQDLLIEDIQQKNDEALKKLKAYQDVPQTTMSAKFLDLIPRLLPEGTWLTELEIKHSDVILSQEGTIADKKVAVSEKIAQPTIEMTGYVFQENVGHQIRLINTFVADLKTEREFSSFFKSIDLLSAQTHTVDGHVVTSFRIVCK
jgi:hypothetical protein